jgi:hypothetical protein
LLETSANTEHLIYNTTPITFTTATQSVYVKPNGRTNVALRFYGAPNDWVARVFSLTGNGSVTQSSAGSSSGFSAVSSSIVNAGNGWYRLSMTATQTSRSVYVASPDLCTSSTPTLAAVNGSEVYAGDITKGVYVWGAQLEAASTVSSYIPTAASTVTRAADVSTSTATSVFESSWYNQTEGTVFARYSFPQSPTAGGGRVFQFANAAATNLIWLRAQGSVNRIYDVTDASVSQASFNQGAYAAGIEYIAALAAKANNFGFAENGGAPQSDSSGTVPSVDRAGIGMEPIANGSQGNVHIRRLTYWPTRLGNEVLQRLTQP